MDLACRSLCAEQVLGREIECILHISRRVIHRGIEGSEIVVVILDLSAFIDLKSHSGKNIDHLVLHLRDRMKVAAGILISRDRDVDLLFLIAMLKLGFLRLHFHVR